MRSARCLRGPRLTALCLVVVCTMGCGPTPQEVGGAVLIVAPIAALVTAGLLRLLAWAFGPAPTLRVNVLRRARAVQFGIMLVLALAQIPLVLNSNVGSYLLDAFWLFGSSLLALVLLTWRLWRAFDHEAAQAWAILPALVLQLIPAALLSTGWFNETSGVDLLIGVLYVFPGYMGIVPAAMLALLASEALVRRLLTRAHTSNVHP